MIHCITQSTYLYTVLYSNCIIRAHKRPIYATSSHFPHFNCECKRHHQAHRERRRKNTWKYWLHRQQFCRSLQNERGDVEGNERKKSIICVAVAQCDSVFSLFLFSPILSNANLIIITQTQHTHNIEWQIQYTFLLSLCVAAQPVAGIHCAHFYVYFNFVVGKRRCWIQELYGILHSFFTFRSRCRWCRLPVGTFDMYDSV